MNSDNTFDSIVNDDSMRDLRKAYHELEAFQLSEEHMVAKDLLKKLLEASPSSEEQKNDR